MSDRFLLKSIIGMAAVLPVVLAVRADLRNFVLSSPASIDLDWPSIGEVLEESPSDHFSQLVYVIDDHQDPVQQSQIDSGVPESSEKDSSVTDELKPTLAVLPEMLEVLNTARLRRKTRTDAQRLLSELERLTPDSAPRRDNDNTPLPDDFIFRNVLEQQRGLASAERELRAARLKNPENTLELLRQIDTVRTLMKDLNLDQVAAHAEFLQLEEAEIHGYELRYSDSFKIELLLAPVAERGFQVLTDRAFEDCCQKLIARIDKLKAYSATYARIGSHAKWATQETHLCERLHSFLEHMRELDESQFVSRIRLVAELCDSDVIPESVRVSLLNGAYQICDNYLPRMVPLDEFVLSLDVVGPNAKAVSVPRADIVLVWDDKRFERLIDSSRNEITIPSNRLLRVIVTGKGTRPPFLRGTQKSEASEAYNSLRGRIDWTVSTLRALQEGCRTHSKYLDVVWLRIEEINMLAAEFPKLFVGVKNR